MLFNFRNIRKMDIRKYINLNCNIKNVNYLDNKIAKDWIIFTIFEWCYTLINVITLFQIFNF